MPFNTKQPAYEALRNIVSERTRQIVAFIGAGLSRSAGLPSWEELRSHLIDVLRRKADTLDAASCTRDKGIAQAAADNPSMWVAFEMLRNALGKETYKAEITSAFSRAARAEVPREYINLLSLRLSGLITTNIDRLTSKAFVKHEGQLPSIEIDGKNCGAHIQMLQSAAPFILNLHGTYEREASWVFTHSDLSSLWKSAGYKEFLQSVFINRVVVFAGITADDIAIRNHLDALNAADIKVGGHFWITDRKDRNSDEWAELNGIRIIRYTADGGNHSELGEMLNDLKRYIPNDAAPLPVTPKWTKPSNTIRPLNELLAENDKERVRSELNSYAAWLLSPRNDESYRAYEKFLKEYDPAIYNAWYTTTVNGSGFNILFGYKLEDEVGEGGFGRVYRAEDASGNKVAIKVLLSNIRQKPEMLQSFRRGVMSMKILSDAHVQGMVPYEFAAEIPACAVMNFIEGPNLCDAVKQGLIKEWRDILEISVQLSDIIRRAHALPQRVLHRDIRPPNIMLEDFYSNGGEIKLAVLDFDLSWHMGATELSVSHDGSANPYLAPEQLVSDGKISTRNDTVDSFGLGMTLYFLLSSKDPKIGQYGHSTWSEHLSRLASTRSCPEWRSLPNRFSRLIIAATREAQPTRPDVAEIYGECKRLLNAMKSPTQVRASDLIAEELACRACHSLGQNNAYEWCNDTYSAKLSYHSGLNVKIRGNETQRQIEMSLEWMGRGNIQYQNIRKYASSVLESLYSECQHSGWSLLDKPSVQHDAIFYYLKAHVNDVALNYDRYVTSVAKCVTAFQKFG